MNSMEINRSLKLMGNKLFKKAVKTGLPIIYLENGRLVRLHNGKKKIIKKIEKTNICLPKKFILK